MNGSRASTGNAYLHGTRVGALLAVRIALAVFT